MAKTDLTLKSADTQEIALFLENYKESIASVIPKHLTPERMINIIAELIPGNTKLS